MAVFTSRLHLGGLARRLVQDGLIGEPEAVSATDEAARQKMPFVAYVVSHKLASAQDIAHSASQEFGVPLVDIQAIDPDPDVMRLVDEKLITRHHALPKEEATLFAKLLKHTEQNFVDCLLDLYAFVSGTSSEMPIYLKRYEPLRELYEPLFVLSARWRRAATVRPRSLNRSAISPS